MYYPHAIQPTLGESVCSGRRKQDNSVSTLCESGGEHPNHVLHSTFTQKWNGARKHRNAQRPIGFISHRSQFPSICKAFRNGDRSDAETALLGASLPHILAALENTMDD